MSCKQKNNVNPKLGICCKMFLMACPFAVPLFGKKGKMPKCDLSLDRLETGLTPACMNVCPAKALHAGPMDELSSLANRKAATRLMRMTDPSFFV